MLAREGGGFDAETFGKTRLIRPGGKSPLARGMADPADGRRHEGLADTESIPDLAPCARFLEGSVDRPGAVQFESKAIEGIDSPGGHGTDLPSELELSKTGEEVIGLAQMDESTNGGFAVGPTVGLDDAPVGVPVGGKALYRCH